MWFFIFIFGGIFACASRSLSCLLFLIGRFLFDKTQFVPPPFRLPTAFSPFLPFFAFLPAHSFWEASFPRLAAARPRLVASFNHLPPVILNFTNPSLNSIPRSLFFVYKKYNISRSRTRNFDFFRPFIQIIRAWFFRLQKKGGVRQHDDIFQPLGKCHSIS